MTIGSPSQQLHSLLLRVGDPNHSEVDFINQFVVVLVVPTQIGFHLLNLEEHSPLGCFIKTVFHLIGLNLLIIHQFLQVLYEPLIWSIVLGLVWSLISHSSTNHFWDSFLLVQHYFVSRFVSQFVSRFVSQFFSRFVSQICFSNLFLDLFLDLIINLFLDLFLNLFLEFVSQICFSNMLIDILLDLFLEFVSQLFEADWYVPIDH